MHKGVDIPGTSPRPLQETVGMGGLVPNGKLRVSGELRGVLPILGGPGEVLVVPEALRGPRLGGPPDFGAPQGVLGVLGGA